MMIRLSRRCRSSHVRAREARRGEGRDGGHDVSPLWPNASNANRTTPTTRRYTPMSKGSAVVAFTSPRTGTVQATSSCSRTAPPRSTGTVAVTVARASPAPATVHETDRRDPAHVLDPARHVAQGDTHPRRDRRRNPPRAGCGRRRGSTGTAPRCSGNSRRTVRVDDRAAPHAVTSSACSNASGVLAGDRGERRPRRSGRTSPMAPGPRP